MPPCCLAAPRQALHQIGAGLLTPGELGCLRGIDAGQADGDGPPSRLNPQGVAVTHRERRGSVAGRRSSACRLANRTPRLHGNRDGE